MWKWILGLFKKNYTHEEARLKLREIERKAGEDMQKVVDSFRSPYGLN